MDNLALLSSKFPVLVGSTYPSEIPSGAHPSLPLPAARGRGATGGARRSRFVASAHRRGGDGASQRIAKADQIALTPEEVISKIMANPEVAMAFQNPKVQATIMDCSRNPLSIVNKEVMEVFTKISELFPGVTGYP